MPDDILNVNDPVTVYNVEFEEDSQDIPVEMEEVVLEHVYNSDHNDLPGRNEPDAHPISAITDLSETLEEYKDKEYIHIQGTSARVWSVVHDLNKYPSVTVVDSANNIVYGDTQYLTKNELEITFSGAFSGKCYCN